MPLPAGYLLGKVNPCHGIGGRSACPARASRQVQAQCRTVPAQELLSTVAGAVGILMTSLAVWWTSKLRTPPSQQTLEGRLEELSRIIRTSGRLLEQVEAELKAREVTAARLKVEAETAQQITRLTQAEREAVARLLRSEVTEESRRSFRKNLVTGGLFFLGGVGATVAVTLFLHPL